MSIAGQTFLVEHYRPGLTVEQFRDAADTMRAAADASEQVRFLHSTLVPEDETAFCVFRAPSMAVVEEAYRGAGVPFERIVPAMELGQKG